MTTLLRTYKKAIQDDLSAASENIESVAESLRRQKANKVDPEVEYIPPPASGPQSRTQLILKGMQHLSSAREHISNFYTEISQQPKKEQTFWRDHASSFEGEVQRLEKQLNEQREAESQASKDDLLLFRRGGQGDDVERVDNETEAQRRAAGYTTKRLQSGTNFLEKAEGLLHSSNATGREVLTTVRVQNEQIRNVGEMVRDVDDEVTQATTIIANMQRTAVKHKIYIYSFFTFIVVALLMIVYIKLS